MLGGYMPNSSFNFMIFYDPDAVGVRPLRLCQISSRYRNSLKVTRGSQNFEIGSCDPKYFVLCGGLSPFHSLPSPITLPPLPSPLPSPPLSPPLLLEVRRRAVLSASAEQITNTRYLVIF